MEIKKKKTIIITTVALGIILVWLLLVHLGITSLYFNGMSCFFSTKYFDTPLDAFNDADPFNHGFDAISVSIKNELGLYYFDEQNALFVAESEEGFVVVSGMHIKDGKYVTKGVSSLYDFAENSDFGSCRIFETLTGETKYALLYTEDEVKNTSGVMEVEEYSCEKGTAYLVVLE